MSKELPHIYKGIVDINTNQKETILKQNEELNIRNEIKSVDSQIKDIFSSDSFLYKADTIITLTNGERIKKTIIGKTNNSLITLDDDLIDINKIYQIEMI